MLEIECWNKTDLLGRIELDIDEVARITGTDGRPGQDQSRDDV